MLLFELEIFLSKRHSSDNSKKKNDAVWLVIDARSANGIISSGISRFIIGITCALAQELCKKRKQSPSFFSYLKILIVSKTEPADWIIELVYQYPEIVTFWKSESRSFFTNLDKPTWLWPTLVLKTLQNMTENKLIWFAPANFDRPLFTSSKLMSSRIIQVIHDCIPFLKVKGLGFLFKRQFKFLVSRSLTKLPYIATVSHYSAQTLNALVKKRAGLLYIISDAVDEKFGCQKKEENREFIIQRRMDFISELMGDVSPDVFINANWIIGVGRNQKYKGWDVALQAIEKLKDTKDKAKLWFIRVGADAKEISAYSKKSTVNEFGKIKVFEGLSLIVLPPITDKLLANLYYISDLMVHPSQAEGFGLPPLEAALCGLPVLYRKGTAVDEHFEEGSLPNNYWNGIDSHYPAVWANQIERLLYDEKISPFFKGLFASQNTRDYILNFSKIQKSFNWSDSANLLLDMIGSKGGIIEKILVKKHLL